MEATAPADSCVTEEMRTMLDAKDREIGELKRQNAALKDQLELAKVRNLFQECQLNSLMNSDSAKRKR